MHGLLTHLELRGFSGAPRFVGVDEHDNEMLTHLDGDTVGAQLPWPTWTHSDEALDDVGTWLREYHLAVADFVPPQEATWREGQSWRPGLIIGHGDPAPYNTVWNSQGLVGFIDWDNAGPVSQDEDLAWVAFSWTPLHARPLVEREGFFAFDDRRRRLELLLGAYGWEGTTAGALDLIDARIRRQIELMRITAKTDPVYQRMIDAGAHVLLESARAQLSPL